MGINTEPANQNAFLPKLKDSIPITKWLPNYDRNWLRTDILAGVILAGFMIPEAMAYAGLAGLPPQSGLYAGIAAPLIYMVLGTTKQLSIGVTSAISILVASGLAFAANGDPLRYAQLASLLAFLVFVIALIAWILKLGFLVNFISTPVVLGFSSGGVLYICSTQLSKLFGITGCHGEFFDRLGCVIIHIDQTHLPSMILGVTGVIVMLVGKHFLPKLPWPLIIVLLSILAISFTGLGGYDIEITGEIPQGLPNLEIPALNWPDFRRLLPTALAVFLLAYVEGMSMARTSASKHDYHIDPNQELLSLAFVNLGAGLTQAYPVAGSMSRSALLDSTGTKSQLAGGIAALIIIIVVIFFSNTFANLPEPILAAVVLGTVMRSFRYQGLRHLYKLQRKEFWISSLALFGVLIFGMLQGVFIGVLLSLLVLVGRASQSRLSVLGRVPEKLSFADITDHPEYHTVPGLMIIRINEGLFFANVSSIKEEIMRLISGSEEKIRAVLIDLGLTDELDYSAIEMLTKLHAKLAENDIRLLFSRVNPDSLALMNRSGLTDLVGTENIYRMTLGALADYLQDFNIHIENVKGYTVSFVNAVSEIYTSLQESSDEAQREEAKRILLSLVKLSEELNRPSSKKESWGINDERGRSCKKGKNSKAGRPENSYLEPGRTACDRGTSSSECTIRGPRGVGAPV